MYIINYSKSIDKKHSEHLQDNPKSSPPWHPHVNSESSSQLQANPDPTPGHLQVNPKLNSRATSRPTQNPTHLPGQLQVNPNPTPPGHPRTQLPTPGQPKTQLPGHLQVSPGSFGLKNPNRPSPHFLLGKSRSTLQNPQKIGREKIPPGQVQVNPECATGKFRQVPVLLPGHL